MIGWVLVIDMTYSSQKIEMVDAKSCLAAVEIIYKANEGVFLSSDSLNDLTNGAFCINVSTGEIRRKGE